MTMSHQTKTIYTDVEIIKKKAPNGNSSAKKYNN